MISPTPWPPEAAVTVNGIPLTTVQAMTMRVGLEMFALWLVEHGEPHLDTIAAGYVRCLREIRALSV